VTRRTQATAHSVRARQWVLARPSLEGQGSGAQSSIAGNESVIEKKERRPLLVLLLATVPPSQNTPQAGIFALGTSSHAFLEFDLLTDAAPRDLLSALAGLREPRTTIGGVNLVIGFRPELWRDTLDASAPLGLTGFTEPVVGTEGFVMPATQHDAFLFLSGSAYDVIFDVARGAISAVSGLACVASEISSWPYRHARIRASPKRRGWRSSRQACLVPAARFSCCSSGHTTRRPGKHSPMSAKKPSSDARSPTRWSSRTSRRAPM